MTVRDGSWARRSVVIGGVVALCVGVVSGVAWAKAGIDKAKGTQAAATYVVTVAPGDERAVTWPRLGDVALGSECFAQEDVGAGTFGVGMKALTVTNNGADPIAVAFDPGFENEMGEMVTFVWLEPSESEAFFVVGEVHNDQTPVPYAGVGTVGILDPDRSSATGLIAFTGEFDTSTHTGTCTFSFQWRG
jgi:hypothetical protein